ncbi:16S rRNA (guanine(966)-N(2))-methyltransferase RsmD [Maledivibacter halophilus]|uniref:16S rRNA (Guanine(966)-N(2))-methyltransferase RsmD n=1 Tax=Maledivibacter halophilus TaxID=36842 RepID=A0A1T5MG60_9FIRM|nr:16S rRNA (guanine(966)-N(2))-methyltransferase RsmD [Maledivibacter halophilus]
MRIISGEAKGVKLKAPKGIKTRPTSDKVKESVFNIIAPYVENSNILDLFSGTGNLGIEAVSRGAAHAYLVEKNRKQYNIIKENILKTKLNDKIEVIIEDVYIALEKFGKSNHKFDIIFMDPPYLKNYIIPCLGKIAEINLLDADGIIIVEHDIKDIIPEVINNLVRFKEKKYGSTMISFYRKEE